MRAGSVVVAAIALSVGPWGAGEGRLLAEPQAPETESSVPNEAPTVEDFAWMAGQWRGEGFGGICEEIWAEPLGGSMVGLFRLVKEGELVFSEHMMLVQESEGIVLKVKHFTPEFVGWEDKEGAVRFRLEEVRSNDAVFNGLRIRRTDDRLEIVLRMKNASGKTWEETMTLHRRP
jgi:hypothetical protein